MRALAVTLKDVAKAADVSIATVSKVLNGRGGEIAISEATRQKVLEAARRLNYHPNISARRLVSQKSNSVGLVIEAYTSFAGPVNAQILQGIGKRLDAAGLDALLVSQESAKDLGAHLKAMAASKKVDAFLLWTRSADAKLCAELREMGVPHCHIGFRPAGQCSMVLSDNVAGGYGATMHLVQQGHRDIAIIVPEQFPEGLERFEGYRRALSEAGIPFNPDLVIRGEYSSTTDASGLDVARLKAILPRCSAIFATSDLLAMAAKEAARSEGYFLGKDIALVGYDGSEAGRHLDPPLTSVLQDGGAMGSAAVEIILAQMQGETAPRSVLVPTRLVVRESSLVSGTSRG